MVCVKKVALNPKRPDLSENEVGELVKLCNVKNYKKGDKIIKEGEQDGNLTIIVSGMSLGGLF